MPEITPEIDALAVQILQTRRKDKTAFQVADLELLARGWTRISDRRYKPRRIRPIWDPISAGKYFDSRFVDLRDAGLLSRREAKRLRAIRDQHKLAMPYTVPDNIDALTRQARRYWPKNQQMYYEAILEMALYGWITVHDIGKGFKRSAKPFPDRELAAWEFDI